MGTQTRDPTDDGWDVGMERKTGFRKVCVTSEGFRGDDVQVRPSIGSVVQDQDEPTNRPLQRILASRR